MSGGGSPKGGRPPAPRCRPSAMSSVPRWPPDEGRIASTAQMRSGRPNSARFNAMSSGTASMTSWASLASSSLVVVLMRASAALRAASLISRLATNCAVLARILARAAVRLSALRPMSRTRQPPAAKISAMPWPMMPLPMTAIVLAFAFAAMPPLLPEIVALDQRVVAQFLRVASFQGYPASDDYLTAISDRRTLVEILLGHQHGKVVALLELADLVDHPADQDRRQPDRGLVDEEEARRRHQGTAERQHLLLAAAHRRRQLPAPLAQHRE